MRPLAEFIQRPDRPLYDTRFIFQELAVKLLQRSASPKKWCVGCLFILNETIEGGKSNGPHRIFYEVINFL